MIRIAAALALIAGAAAIIFFVSRQAENDLLVLDLPIDCEMGARCYIQSYVDRDPGPGAADFTCGSLTYDGHKGVDFRVATFAEMESGVSIIAAASGHVRAIRDGVDDLGAENYPEGQDCGNAVVLTHDNGWETQYCHLAKGSIAVQSGDQIEVGDQLGLMGFSGRTEFPHLHLSIRKGGEPVDPFGAQNASQSCETAENESLWSENAQSDLTYRPGGIVDIGVTGSPPDLVNIRQGDQPSLDQASADTLFVWGRFFGVQEGDLLTISLTGPDGEIVTDETRVNRNRAEEMRYAGARNTSGWPKGGYQAIAILTRKGKIYDRLQQDLVLN